MNSKNFNEGEPFEIDPEFAKFLDQRPLPDSIQNLTLGDNAEKYAKSFHESVIEVHGEKQSIPNKIIQLTKKIKLIFQNEVEILLAPMDLSGLANAAARSAVVSNDALGSENKSCVRLKGKKHIGQLEIIGDEQSSHMTFVISLLNLDESPTPSFRYTLGAEGFGVHPEHNRRISGAQSVELANLEVAHYSITLEPEDSSDKIVFEF